MTFGGDALPGPDCSKNDGRYRPECQPWSRFSGYVLTRLHARYTKDTLGEDLVFRAAEPIAGGREQMSADGKLEHGATKASMNNFQGRYAIRHPWTGPITCQDPKRGIWGGPPAALAGKTNPPPPAPPAKGAALHPRGSPLTSYVPTDNPEPPASGMG